MSFPVRILRLFGFFLLSLCALGVAGLTWAWLVEPNLLFVREVDYRIPQWQNRGRPLKVVIAGDLHLMPTRFDQVRAQRYVQKIMRMKPDMILLVGDYARGSIPAASMSPRQAAAFLKDLNAPYGVFAIQGNHDYTFGWNNWRKAFTAAGIKVLDNATTLITFPDNRRLQLSGIMDSSRNSRALLPKRQSPDIPHILLSHHPGIDRILSGDNVDLVISGHTHGGQICLPFNLVWFEARPDHEDIYTYPWHTSGGHRYLITKGLGTTTLPLRFNCPPEIYLLTLH